MKYLGIQRQKVADALSDGVNVDAFKPVSDSVRAGVDTLWVDVSLDVPGNVRFVGYVALRELLVRGSGLDNSRGGEAYSAQLKDLEDCLDVGMYYYGNNLPAATVGLMPKVFRDSFGDFLGYQPSLHFRSGVSISVIGFFKSHEFEPYREDLNKLLSILLQ
ncbi:MAG: hypothetical protein J5771_01815 [Bacteroidales bacterium]|nr:hypothetical protein [Bacteroidales bacterium]